MSILNANKIKLSRYLCKSNRIVNKYQQEVTALLMDFMIVQLRDFWNSCDYSIDAICFLITYAVERLIYKPTTFISYKSLR